MLVGLVEPNWMVKDRIREVIDLLDNAEDADVIPDASRILQRLIEIEMD